MTVTLQKFNFPDSGTRRGKAFGIGLCSSLHSVRDSAITSVILIPRSPGGLAASLRALAEHVAAAEDPAASPSKEVSTKGNILATARVLFIRSRGIYIRRRVSSKKRRCCLVGAWGRRRTLIAVSVLIAGFLRTTNESEASVVS